MEKEEVGWARRCVDGGEGEGDIWVGINQHCALDGMVWKDHEEGLRSEDELVLRIVGGGKWK